MSNSPTHGTLATRLAALQQMLRLAPREGALRPFADADPAAARAALGVLPLPALIGASKMQPVSVIEEAIGLGLMAFGENRVQEAEGKWPALKARHPGVRLHLIGPLQSNKAREAVALFDVIQTVDRPKIADALAEAMKKEGRRPDILIQVNTGEEPQKAGVAPRALPVLLAHCRALDLPVTGLMCVPPADDNPAPHFALMKKMANRYGLAELSMGMSGDYAVAARFGATMVRIGTALFGERLPQS